MKSINNNEKKTGATLLMLLIFVIVATTMTTATTAVMIANSQGAQKAQQSSSARFIAESGAENAIIRLIRDQNYTGETLTIGDGTATINVTGTTDKIITSTGVDGNFVRKVQVYVNYNNSVLNIISWREIF